MNEKTSKIIIISLFIMGIIFVIVGSTFAYLTVNTVTNNTSIGGSTYNFNVNFDVSAVKSGNLIPVKDNLILESLNSSYVCEDTRGYRLCSLYRIRFTNSGSAQTLTGNLKTVSSTYTTTNLKYQLFTLSGSTYSAISDSASINNTTNSLNQFKLNNSSISISLNDGSASSTIKDVYLVIWVSDPNNNQLADQNKSFTGQLSFVSTSGDTITSSFINS